MKKKHHKLCFAAALVVSVIAAPVAAVAQERGDCIWENGRYGEDITCPSAHLAFGACGSGRNADCGRNTWAKLYCCEKSGVRPVGGIHVKSGRYGKRLECGPGEVVIGLCGSGKNADCGPHVWTEITCSRVDGMTITGQCQWYGARYGVDLKCGSGDVMKGACGSGKNADCRNKTWHEIKCCQTKKSGANPDGGIESLVRARIE